MKAKYRLKSNKYDYRVVERLEVCLRCGKKRIVVVPEFLPVANPSIYQNGMNWFDCFLNIHYFADSSSVEENT